MRSFMDDVAYNARGNEVTLRRFRTTAGGTFVVGQGNVEVPTVGPRAATDPPLAGRRLPAEHPDSQETDQ